MAKVEVMIVKCDKCGTESGDESQFRHVAVSQISPIQKGKNKGQPNIEKEQDLCLSCLGGPGVNVK